MKSKHSVNLIKLGILLFVIAFFSLLDAQAFLICPASNYLDSLIAKDNSLTKSSLKVQNMSDALNQQKKALRNIIDNGKHVPDYFLYYDIVYFNKLANESYEVGVLGSADYATMINHTELYSFNIETSESKDKGNLFRILNITRGSLGGLLDKEMNLPGDLDEYNIIYYRDNSFRDYEFGIEANGKQYYFLIENHSRSTPKGNWAILGWSEGMVPDDWNAVLAMQKYKATEHKMLSEKEYEEFLPDYIDRIYKLIDDSLELFYDADKRYGSKHYKLKAAYGKELYTEAEKVMGIGVSGKYEEAHRMLVKTMYEIGRITAVYVDGHESCQNEVEYNNRGYDTSLSYPRKKVDELYTCYETKKRNEAFTEWTHYIQENKNKMEMSKAIDEYYKSHPVTGNPSYTQILRKSTVRYAFFVEEFGPTKNKSYYFIIEKNEKGEWIMISKNLQPVIELKINI